MAVDTLSGPAGIDEYLTNTPDPDWRCTVAGCVDGDEDTTVAGLCAGHQAEYIHDDPLTGSARVEGTRVVITLDTTGYDNDRAAAVLEWAAQNGLRVQVGVFIDAWSDAQQKGVA